MPHAARISTVAFGALTSFAAARSAAQTAKLTGAVHGTLLPAACGTPTAGVPLSTFQETTPANAPSASGTFELSIISTCVAPFFQALLSQEAVAATFDLGGGYALSLTNARLTHVNLDPGKSGGGIQIAVGIASTQVAVVTPGSSPATVPASAPAKASSSSVSASAAAAAVKQSGAGIAATAGTNVARTAVSSPRTRAPTIQPTAATANIPAAAGQSWASGGARLAVHLTAASPALNEPADGAHDYSVSAHATVNSATGMPSAPFQISFVFTGEAEQTPPATTYPYPLVSNALYAAALARGPLTQAVITWVSGSATGVTLWLKSPQFSGGHSAPAIEHMPFSTVSITAAGLTVTDIGSGRTASYP